MDFDVVVVGCGPAGAMLAAELGLHGVRVLVVDKEVEPASIVRVVGLHVRSLEVMAMRGVLDRLLEHGRKRPAGGFFAAIDKPAPVLDSAYGYLLGIPQPVVVRLLEEWAVEVGATVRRGVEVVGFGEDDGGVTVEIAGGERVRARYLVGCDGARSVVRKRLGVAFEGEAARTATLMGEMEVGAPAEEVSQAVREVGRTDKSFSLRPFGGGVYQVVVPGAEVGAGVPTLDEFKLRLRDVAGTDFGVHSPRWLSRFGDATLLAERYRVGRVLLAGDAAHIHPPIGGQGLNLGVQDAVNLGWKLAGEVRGWAPESLLDTYEAERRPVAADVLDNTRAQRELLSSEPGAQAVRRLLAELMDIDEVNRRLIEKIVALDIRYDFGDGSELVGRRMPDVEVAQGNLYDGMRRGRGVLLDRTGRLDVGGWADRVDLVADTTTSAPERAGHRSAGASAPDRVDLRPAGSSAAGSAVLVRPDGYVAWIGDDQKELEVHLARWFGDYLSRSASARASAPVSPA
ncbi:FAD-dependent monooxygenase [Kribbella sp. NPDC051770]|uniref:FAD-dependent monooxygenase n=1 Tax=Kribbella sp. NPDC051770 TaxID=3155413 RepID=UPI00342862D7